MKIKSFLLALALLPCAAILLTSDQTAPVPTENEVDVFTYAVTNTVIPTSLFFQHQAGKAVAVINCTNAPVNPVYTWSGHIRGQPPAGGAQPNTLLSAQAPGGMSQSQTSEVMLDTSTPGTFTVSVLISGPNASGTMVTLSGSTSFTVTPRAQCHSPYVIGPLEKWECGHSTSPQPSDKCEPYYIRDILLTASCIHDPGNRTPPDCNVTVAPGLGAVTQTLHAGPCPAAGRPVVVEPWLSYFYGCGISCTEFPLRVACVVSAPAAPGPVTAGPQLVGPFGIVDNCPP